MKTAQGHNSKWKFWQLTLNYPLDVAAAASHLDTLFWELLEFAGGFHIPRADKGVGGGVRAGSTGPADLPAGPLLPVLAG
jgi:hypothetical protein